MYVPLENMILKAAELVLINMVITGNITEAEVVYLHLLSHLELARA